MDLEKGRRETLRWRILQTLNVGRPYPVAEDVLYATVGGEDMPISILDLRRETDYLEGRGLLAIDRTGPSWSARLTREGVDVVEYTVEAEPGIARPAKYW